jgi:hypothetical protein
MGYKLTRSGQPDSLIPANEVAIGELVEEADFDGGVLLGTYDGLVSLSTPTRTWSFRQSGGSGPTFPVRRLPPGESVTLTVTPK